MTIQNDGTTIDNEQELEKTPEQLAQEEKDAEAGFEAGFNKVAKHDEAPNPDDKKDDTTAAAAAPVKTDAEKEAEAKAKAEAEKAAAEKQWEGVSPVVRDKLQSLDALTGRLSNIEGHIGGLKTATTRIESALKEARTAAASKGEDAPTDKQVQAALADPEAWKKFSDEFPDFAKPIEAEIAALRAELAKKGGAAEKVDLAKLKSEIKTEVRTEFAHDVIEERHEGWVNTVRSDGFKAWLTGQPDETKSLAASPKARDAIKLLDSFKEHQDKTAKEQQERDRLAEEDRRRKARLEAGVTPKGTTAQSGPGAISDEQAFERGFKKVAKSKAA